MSPPAELPLFLLDTVLHPGGRLPLRVFETRYMDMVRACLRRDAPFGVCLIARGEEVATPGAAPAEPHPVGTLARIAAWDMPQFGILDLVAHGGERFRVLGWRAAADGLILAEVAPLPDPPVTPIPAAQGRLVPMLRAILEALEDEMPPKPHRFYDAAWVADRWAEILPLPMATRQRLLELDDGVARLEIVHRFIEQVGRT